MVKYVYYDGVSQQVAAIFDTPNLSDQANWVSSGFDRALVPSGMRVEVNGHILSITPEGFIGDVVNPSPPSLPDPAIIARRFELTGKLAAGSINLAELIELMQLERGL